MKKRVVAIAIATAIVFAIVPLALAGTHGKAPAPKRAKGKPFLCKGSVVSVDPAAGTLVVTLTKTSHVMRNYVGTDVTFTLSKKARVLARVVGATDGSVRYKRVTLDQVTPGSRAHINGRLDRSNPDAPIFYATLVKVVLAPAASPSPSPSPSESAAP